MYGAYFNDGNGYFLNVSPNQMAFTFSYQTTSVDNLPHKDDLKLQEMLQEASKIVESITYLTQTNPDVVAAIKATGNWSTQTNQSMALSNCSDKTVNLNVIYQNVTDMDLTTYPLSQPEIDSTFNKVDNIAMGNGWQKCNSLKTTESCSTIAVNAGKCTVGEVFDNKVIDIYKKGSQLMNINRSYGVKPGFSLFNITFITL